MTTPEPGSTPAPDVVRAVLAPAAQCPDDLAMVTLTATGAVATVTFGQLSRRVTRMRDGLLAAGLRPGDPVLFSVRPGPRAVVAALALVDAGAVVIVTDPGTSPAVTADRAALLARWRPPVWAAAESVLLTACGRGRLRRPLRQWAARHGLALPHLGDPTLRHLSSGPRLPGAPAGTLHLESLPTPGPSRPGDPGASGTPGTPGAPGAPGAPGEGAAADLPALVVFTSGTTGAPRAVVHGRAGLGAALELAAGAFPLGPGDRMVSEQLMIGLASLARGATWVVPQVGEHAADFVLHLHRMRATHAFTTPVGWRNVLARTAPGLPSTLRVALTGGAPVPAPLMERLCDKGIRAFGIYGGTEMLPVAVIEHAASGGRACGTGRSVGRPLPGVQVRTDPVDGELLVRGPHLCLGYLTAEGVQPLPEWRTGDAADLTADGIVLRGRLKDMIIRGSTNIYPGLYLPGVLAVPGVRDAALVGLPDPVTADEYVVLALELADPSALQAVRAILPEVFDADALPDEVVVVPALPRSGRSAKPDLEALRGLLRTRPHPHPPTPGLPEGAAR